MEDASNKRKAPEAWLGESKSKWGGGQTEGKGKGGKGDGKGGKGKGDGKGKGGKGKGEREGVSVGVGGSGGNQMGHWSTGEVTHGGSAASVSLEVGQRSAAGLEIYVKYLPPKCTPEQVYAHFESCGPIAGDVRLMYNHSTGNVIRGFITFDTDAGFQNALAKDLSHFQGRSISVIQATTTGTMQAAGTHTPALLAEILRRLIYNPDGVYVDGTFGRGGHSRSILEKLSPQGRLHAFDVDDEAIEWGKALMKEDSRFTIHQRWFGDMAAELAPLGIEPAGVLLDIGISSPQLDGGRGFRPEMDGPLDMRFDVDHGESAWEWLQTCSREVLVQILIDYGGENPQCARRIADALMLARQGLWPGAPDGIPKRSQEFAALVVAAKGKEYQKMHSAKMTFQALRIHINREFEELKRGMTSALRVMKPGGKLGIITWKHSECSIVVDQYRNLEVTRQDFPLLVWYNAAQKALKAGDDSQLPRNRQPNSNCKTAKKDMAQKNLKKMHGFLMEDVSSPTDDELKVNSRSRSALLHVFEKHKGVLASTLENAAYPLFGWDLADSQTTFVAPPATLQDGLVELVDPSASKNGKKAKKNKAKGATDGNANPAAKPPASTNEETTLNKKKKKKKKGVGAKVQKTKSQGGPPPPPPKS
jgi:16S rRNA (cytosine1402-N4)-methyltransferase